MLKPGMRVTFQRPRRKEVEVEILRPDPRGFWVGALVTNGRRNKTYLRTFKPEHVTAIMTEDGPRCVFREVL